MERRSSPELPYQVLVDDNFHYMDEDERTTDGAYADCATATARCVAIVESSLRHLHRDNMSAADLLAAYRSFGDDPWIATADTTCSFSAWTFAERRATEICEAK